MKKKRFLVSAYYAKNLGDDLFLKVLFDRYPTVQWDLLTANRSYNEIFKKYKNVRIVYSYRGISLGKKTYNLFYKLHELFLDFSNYEGLINIGGSIFMQSPSWKFKKEEREYLLKKFKERKKKAFILGANFGPFNDKIFLDEYMNLFPEYDDICFRELLSYEIFKDLGNVRVAPDIIFSMKKTKKSQYISKRIGISLINLENREELRVFQNNYMNKMVQIIEQQVLLGNRVDLFSFCENEGDLEMINQIKAKTNRDYHESINVINYLGNIEEFLKKFSSCDIIIGTRFHSIVLALLNDQPVFPIIYSDKTKNVLDDLGLSDAGCNIKDIHNLDIDRYLPMGMAQINRIKEKAVIREAENHFIQLDSYIYGQI
jgi:colanic acid/amylovoran biosynthesis protein